MARHTGDEEIYLAIIDLEGRVRSVNHLASQAGERVGELLRGHRHLVSDDGGNVTLADIIARTRAHGAWHGLIHGHHPRRGPVTLEAHACLLHSHNGLPQSIAYIVRDVTAQRRAEAEREQLLAAEREQRLLAETLAEVTLALTAHTSHEAVLDEILRQTQRLVPFTTAHIMLLHHNTLRVARWQGYTAYDAEALISTLEQPLDRFPIDAEVIRTRTPVVIADTYREPRWVRVRETAWVRSCLMVPICLHDRAIGLLRLDSDTPGNFTEADAQRLKPLSYAAAVAIENARLYAQERERAAALARALEQQRQLDRVQSEFIQNVSHELRTPLAIAWGYVQLLAGGDLGELQPEQRRAFAIIARRLEELAKLVENINAILDLERGEMVQQPVDMATLVHSVLRDFRPIIEENDQQLTTHIPDGLPPVRGDPTALRHVVDNLMSNACKFTPPGRSIAISLAQEGPFIRLEVQDTGIGIPETELERIFDRFYQVDGSATRRYGGTGLGLALVRETVIAHNGTLEVQSQVGEGSTFIVRLPVMTAPSPNGAPLEALLLDHQPDAG